MKQFTILSPTAILGYGFPMSSFETGLTYHPDLIAVDAGSTDPGPYYLGTGKSFTDRSGVMRDLRIILTAAIPRKIPVVIGTAGGCGALPHVNWTREIIDEIAREHGLSFKLAVVPSDVPHELVLEKIASGRISPLEHDTELTPDVVAQTSHIVAQIGVESLQKAL